MLLFGMGLNVYKRVWKRVWSLNLWVCNWLGYGRWMYWLLVLKMMSRWILACISAKRQLSLSHVLSQHWLINSRRNTLSQLRTSQAFIEFWPLVHTNIDVNRPVTFKSNACTFTHWIPCIKCVCFNYYNRSSKKISKPQYKVYWTLLLIQELSLNRSSKMLI